MNLSAPPPLFLSLSHTFVRWSGLQLRSRSCEVPYTNVSVAQVGYVGLNYSLLVYALCYPTKNRKKSVFCLFLFIQNFWRTHDWVEIGQEYIHFKNSCMFIEIKISKVANQKKMKYGLMYICFVVIKV